MTKLIVVATHVDGYYKILEESAKKNGFELITLGMGQKWQGFSMKPRLLKDYIQNIDPNEIIVHCDAFDVIINGTANQLINRFNQIGHNIVYGTENMNSGTGLDVKIIAHYGFPSCNNHILNSGTVVAKAGKFLELINMTCDIEGCQSGDDQVKLNNMCNKRRDFFDKNVYVDTKSKLIINGGCENMMKYLKNTPCNFELIYNKANNTMITSEGHNPILIHGNGNVNIDEICQKLGYDVNTVVKRDDYTSFLLKPHKNEILTIATIMFCILSALIYFQKYNVSDNNNLNNLLLAIMVVLLIYSIRVFLYPITWIKDFC